MATSEAKNQSARELLEPKYLDVDELLDDLEKDVVVQASGLFGRASLQSSPIEPEKRKIALSISGGGTGGAYSAGALETLLGRMRKRGIPIDILVGTSAGALNSYGVFLEELGLSNPQLSDDPHLRQPYSTFIASIWSYLDRHRRSSRWVVGRRAWMIDLATRGLNTPLRRWGFTTLTILAVIVLNPFLFISIMMLSGLENLLPEALVDWTRQGDHVHHLAMLGLLSLGGLCFAIAFTIRTFGESLFRDTPILSFLANTGPKGDLTVPLRWPREQTEDRARVLSRDIVAEWYSRRDQYPELIITATDITLGEECLFTLVHPETYHKLAANNWLTVQLDSRTDTSKRYRERDDALFTLSENLLHCIVGSAAVPSAFPAQEIGIYGAGRKEVRHRFVDGGVLNNSPVHLAIDAGATHIITLELEPMEQAEPLDKNDKGRRYNLIEAGVTTFTTLLRRSIDKDIRRTVTWNRFLFDHPEALDQPKRSKKIPRHDKRVIHLYRVAPAEREIGTVDFDGRYVRGKQITTLRDVLRRGVVDLQGKHIWRATLQHSPHATRSDHDAS